MAHWFNHANAVNPSPPMRQWLTDRMSLTVKLVAQCGQFRVQRLRQTPALCLVDEAELVGLARAGRVRQREVLLLCDEQPVVFAHTIVPVAATATDWPFFSSLGERSLGTTLFGDPLVKRGALQFARLNAAHPLAQRARAAAGAEFANDAGVQRLFARRCLYARKSGLLLVTEVFLPGIAQLGATATKAGSDTAVTIQTNFDQSNNVKQSHQ